MMDNRQLCIRRSESVIERYLRKYGTDTRLTSLNRPYRALWTSVPISQEVGSHKDLLAILNHLLQIFRGKGVQWLKKDSISITYEPLTESGLKKLKEVSDRTFTHNMTVSLQVYLP